MKNKPEITVSVGWSFQEMYDQGRMLADAWDEFLERLAGMDSVCTHAAAADYDGTLMCPDCGKLFGDV